MKILYIALALLASPVLHAADLGQLAEEAAAYYKIDENLVKSVIEMESETTPYAIGVGGHPFLFKEKSKALKLLNSLEDHPWLLVMKKKGMKNRRYLFKTEQAGKAHIYRHPGWETKLFRVVPKHIDIGAMQINLYWHGEQFKSYSHMLDARTNVFYGTRYLSSKVRKYGLEKGVGRYNSSDEVKLAQYSKSVLSIYDRIAN